MEQAALKIRGLVKTFPQLAKYPQFKLGPIDLTVPKGSLYGLIGPNAAGKTTTIDLVMGMGAKNAGSIEVLGLDHVQNEVRVKAQIGYVSPDMPFEPWGTVKRLISFFRNFYPDWDDEYCKQLLERLNVPWGDKIATLSFGTRIKLGLVLALSHRPALLLLDEPFVGLDAVSKQEIFTELLDAVRDPTRSVLVSSHNLHDLERYTDCIGIIHHGKMLLEGPTAELVEQYQMVDCIAPNGQTPERIPGVHVQQRDGQRWRLLANVKDGALERLTTAGLTDVAATPVTLEELFIALVQEK